MVNVIDAVVNLWTPEIVKTRAPVREKLLYWEHIMQVGDEWGTGVPLNEMILKMDEAGIDKAFLIATDIAVWEIPHEKVAEQVEKFPDRFYGLAGINPLAKMKGVRKLERAVKEYGFIGAHVYPHWYGLPPNDKAYYPFYAKCVELDIPIEIQIGHSAQTHLKTVAFPITLDEVAIDFPELSIIGIHTGWPWIEEAIAVAWKHPNVFLGCDAHAPKYWDPRFVRFINTRGQDKVIYGSDWPVISFDRMMREIEAHNFKEEAKAKLLRDNALRVFKLKV